MDLSTRGYTTYCCCTGMVQIIVQQQQEKKGIRPAGAAGTAAPQQYRYSVLYSITGDTTYSMSWLFFLEIEIRRIRTSYHPAINTKTYVKSLPFLYSSVPHSNKLKDTMRVTALVFFSLFAACSGVKTPPAHVNVAPATTPRLPKSENAEYLCYVCTVSVEHSIATKEESVLNSCQSLFGVEGAYLCEELNDFFYKEHSEALRVNVEDIDSDPRSVCEQLDVCLAATRYPFEMSALATGTATSLDIRVSKGYGSRGYDKVRLSVISNAAIESSLFTYTKQFQYRWTDFYLNTGIVTVTPGEVTSFDIAGESVDILIPVENTGIRGAVFGDPCFTNEFVWCTYGEKFNTLNRSTELLNAMNAHDDVNFWMILGDNFYDQSGEPTAQWFSMLSKESKQKIYASVVGNHDLWILSAPLVWMKRKDQLGFGFMQYNAQDTAASVQPAQIESEVPFDFSVNPDAEDATAHSIPPASNFFSYFKLGNVGFIAYSGAHTFDESSSLFDEACQHLNSETGGAGADAVVLLGHWNTPGLGCPEDMNVPKTYRQLIAEIPSCAAISDKMRYIMGHMHCNVVYEQDVGFMVAGQGMTASVPCEGNYGLPIIDTFNSTFSIYFFDIQQWDEYDNYDTILECVKENGVSGCYHLATQWTSTPLQMVEEVR